MSAFMGMGGGGGGGRRRGDIQEGSLFKIQFRRFIFDTTKIQIESFQHFYFK